MDRKDLNAFLAAMLVHAGIAFALVKVSKSPKKGPDFVEVAVHNKEVPAEKPVPPPVVPPPEQPKPKIEKKKANPVLQAPVPNQEPPKDPPKDPPKPVVGLSADSMSENGNGLSFQPGNTTIGDPNHPRQKVEDIKPLPPAPPAAAPAPVFKAVSALEVKSEPDWDEESCKMPYPDGPARDEGIEGDTMLRVEIDEKGKVHGVKVIKGVGHGLDELAIKAIRYKCKFGPARNTAGAAVPFAITYSFHWVLDR